MGFKMAAMALCDNSLNIDEPELMAEEKDLYEGLKEAVQSLFDSEYFSEKMFKLVIKYLPYAAEKELNLKDETQSKYNLLTRAIKERRKRMNLFFLFCKKLLNKFFAFCYTLSGYKDIYCNTNNYTNSSVKNTINRIRNKLIHRGVKHDNA